MGRTLLVNWLRELLIGAISIWTTWVVYENIIKLKKTLLPDLTTATNELWVFVAIFVYFVLNQVDTGTRGAEKRKENFLRKRFSEMMQSYGAIFQKNTPDKLSESLAITILLYESFNRPWLAQKIERLVFPHYAKSLGPMQVKTRAVIDDVDSVRLGVSIVVESYQRQLMEIAKEHDSDKPLSRTTHRWMLISRVAADYNRDDQYVSDIVELHRKVLDLFYFDLISGN
jgi:hypothetical protein